MSLNIPLPNHFNYEECLWYLDRGMDECLYSIEDNAVRKVIALDDQKALVHIQKNGAFLQVKQLSGQLNDDKLRANIIAWFDLERDLDGFYKMASSDMILAPLVKRYSGLRLMAIVDLFEALCWSIIGQQINLSFAYKLKRALVTKFGSNYELHGRRYYLFPTPEALLQAKQEDLLALQFSRQKATYLISLSRNIVEGRLNKEALQQLTFSEALQQLSSLHGIGPWTANYVAMRCLKFMTAFPMGDAGLQNAIKHALQQQRKPTIQELEVLSEKWQGWQAYATLFLWRSLSNKA